jgi:hypothetical protein
MAGQIVGGLARFGTAFAMGGPMAVVANEQMRISQEVADAGGGLGTIVGAGAARGALTGLGLRVPAAVGASVRARVATGAAINTSLGVADRAVLQEILASDNLDALAAQYQPFDAVQLMVDAAFGGLVGGLTKGDAATTADPEVRAAAQTLALRDAQARVFLLANDEARDQAADVLDNIIAMVRSGEPVAVSDAMPIGKAALDDAVARVDDGLRAEQAIRESEAQSPPRDEAEPRAFREPSEQRPDSSTQLASALDDLDARILPMAQERPDMAIEVDFDDGAAPVRMTLAEAADYLREEMDRAATDSKAFDAAANCFLASAT